MSALLFRCLQLPILQFSVRAPVIILGRSADCEFVVGHESVSRRHAEIRRSDNKLEVRDLRSLNGTFVSGQRIESCRVEPGHIVRFGSIEFKLGFQTEEEMATDIPPPHPQREHGGVPPLEASLSKAQSRVFALLIKVLSEKMIAKALVLSRHTIHNHTRVIFRTFNVHSRVQLLALATQVK